jgi:DNA primase
MLQQEVPTVTQTSGHARIVASTQRVQPKAKPPMAHRIDFEAIKRASRFERVLTYYGIELRGGRGPQRKALCPFHRDTRPSLNVNLDMKVFNCFACGGGGDIIKFVAMKEHPTDPEGNLVEAVEKLAEICGIRIDDHVKETRAKPPDQREAAGKEVTAGSSSAAPAASGERQNGESDVPNPPLTFQLKVDPKHPYLAERGLSPETIETFGLGYCVSEKSIMRQRIVIPIHNEDGDLVAYAGRWPSDSGWPEDADRYMLPRKFQKMRVLFNLHRVIESRRAGQWPGHEHHVVVVEGFFGVFAVHQHAPCVALMGAVISKEHLDLLARADIRYVTLMLDGPSKGFTPDERRIWDDRITATIHTLATCGFFVRARGLELAEQPDTISRDRLARLVSRR